MSVSAFAGFPLTMPRGYRLLRFVHKSCRCSGIVWQTSKNSGWIDSDLHIILWFWRLNGKCQGWSRGRGRREWANWFNKHRTDRWWSETKTLKKKDNKKVIRARRLTSEGKNGRESPWWKVVVHHGSQISRPENIFKYNKNSTKRQSPNVGNIHPALSLYQSLGIKVSAPDWG